MIQKNIILENKIAIVLMNEIQEQDLPISMTIAKKHDGMVSTLLEYEESNEELFNKTLNDAINEVCELI